MRKQLAYDLPTRFFHWLFAALFIFAFAIAKLVDDESPTYAYHMLAGLTLAFAVLLRIIWGFVGSEHARFTSFALNPLDLIEYFKSMLGAGSKKYFGHNPASSWAAILMFALSLGLAFTGVQMASDNNKEFYEEIHELFANAFIVTVLLHIAGIVFHSIRHKDMIALSMIDGKKSSDVNDRPIKGHSVFVAILFIALMGVFVNYLAKNYDTQNGTLNFFGTKLQLGDNENEQGEQQEGNENEGTAALGNEGQKDDDDD